MCSWMSLEDFKQKSHCYLIYVFNRLFSLLLEEWTVGGKIEAGDKIGGYFRVELGPRFYGINDAF